MSRYIDADAFKRCLQDYRPYVDSGRFNDIQTEVHQVLDCIEYEIEDAPTIEIIRCGECKHWNEEDHWCNIRDSYGWDYKPDDFCSYGVRKGADDE